MIPLSDTELDALIFLRDRLVLRACLIYSMQSLISCILDVYSDNIRNNIES